LESASSKSTPATHPKPALKKTPATKNNATAQPKPINSHQTSIEDVTEEDHYICPNAGPLKNPNAILEAANGSDDTDMVIDDNHNDPKMPPLVVDNGPEDSDEDLKEEIQEENDEKELGILTV
jgi:hypothetical protein